MLSPRLAAIVDALPLSGTERVLEVGCGPGAAARAVAARAAFVLATDRSARAIAQAKQDAPANMGTRCVAAEDLVLEPGEAPYDLVFAVRVGGLDGRHPDLHDRILDRLRAATTPGARLFVDGAERPLHA